MTALRFGTFVWVDAGDRPLHQLYDDHLALAALADELGFFGYHLAEHHCTPLGLAPSPNVMLAAVARATERIRLGPLVLLLPLYEPLRLVEEVAMIDQLSHGRLELGVGRGVSPWELAHCGVEPARSRARFHEVLAELTQGLGGHGDRFGSLGGAPIEVRPLQRPYPPLTYATTNPDSVEWAARHGINLAGLGPAERFRDNVERYRRTWDAHRGDPDRLNAHVEAPRISLNRHIVVAETDEEAHAVLRRAYPRHAASFMKLWEDHGDDTYRSRIDLDAGLLHETVLAGSPETVRDAVERLVADAGIDYLIGAFAWGGLSREESARSMRLFAEEVAPAFR